MNTEKFEQIANTLIDVCKGTLINKAREYSRSDDRLHNFYRAAEIKKCHPVDALTGMKLKHDVSIYDICKDVMDGKFVHPTLLTEKIVDSINYLILLNALILEIQDNKSKLQEDVKQDS